MIWDSWNAFWQMGGAGFYVWGSYGVTLILIVVELLMVFRRRRDTLIRLRRLRRANGGRPSFKTDAASEDRDGSRASI